MDACESIAAAAGFGISRAAGFQNAGGGRAMGSWISTLVAASLTTSGETQANGLTPAGGLQDG
jgi:hypothetical protein